MRMVKRREFINALMRYHRNYYTDGGFPSIFSLQIKMIEMGICPRCGKKSPRWNCDAGHFPCLFCGFKLTRGEAEKVCDDDISQKVRKRILGKRLSAKTCSRTGGTKS